MNFEPLPQIIKFVFCLALFSCLPDSHLKGQTHDIVIYGGTSAGIVAAIEADTHGKSVLLIEPTGRLGGLTTGGLGQTDIGSKTAVGGLSLQFYRRVSNHYSKAENWRWQKPTEYRDTGQTRTNAGESAMWTFEPSAALKIYQDWLSETKVEVLMSCRLDRETSIEKVNGRIVSITTKDGKKHSGKFFIDATYEGDLMAAAGISYATGREDCAKYQESLNGVQTNRAIHHNFVDRVDPFVKPGVPASGLLPGIEAVGPGTEQDGDHRIQAYCFRMCLTDHPDNRIPFQKPKTYDEQRYELLFRNFEAGADTKDLPWINSAMPNRKTDTNNRDGFSTDFIGANYDYPEASDAEREKIVAAHLDYQRGLMWTLANHQRVPKSVRDEVSRWGTCKDEFAEGGSGWEKNEGWQKQLYIREARRMVSDYVQTEHDCLRNRVADDSIGMGAYTMDSHHVQRYVTKDGFVKNEGDFQVSPKGPYVISYRAIIPRREECKNLLVPVCVSSSHVAFGSIRMEPVFMVLAHSAAAAACIAIDNEQDIQDVPYAKLRQRLLAEGQVLDIPQKYLAQHDLEPANLPGVVIDDNAAVLVGNWKFSTAISPHIGKGYAHDNNENKGHNSATFSTTLKESGRYEVRLAYSANANRATNVPVVIRHADGETRVIVNQREEPAESQCWISLGEYSFSPVQQADVLITNEATDGYVILDAIQWLKK